MSNINNIPSILDDIGRNIRNERESQNLTQGDLAELANLTRHTVMRIERNDRSCSLYSFLSIMTALNVKPQKLISYDNNS